MFDREPLLSQRLQQRGRRWPAVAGEVVAQQRSNGVRDRG